MSQGPSAFEKPDPPSPEERRALRVALVLSAVLEAGAILLVLWLKLLR
jgi:hypothetical protein